MFIAKSAGFRDLVFCGVTECTKEVNIPHPLMQYVDEGVSNPGSTPGADVLLWSGAHVQTPWGLAEGLRIIHGYLPHETGRAKLLYSDLLIKRVLDALAEFDLLCACHGSDMR